MSRFLRRGAHLCASGFSASAAHVSFTTYRSIFAARFLFASFILIASLIGLQPTYAVDYVVTGPNTSTNGDLNFVQITGIGDTLTLTNGSSITATNAEGIHFNNAGQNTIENLGSISTIGAYAFGIWNQSSANSTISNSGSITTLNDFAHGIEISDSADSTINSSGIIVTSGENAYGMFNLISVGNSINNSGLIITSGQDAQGIYNLNSAGSTISNSGSISTSNSRANGVFNFSSANSTINNTGSISTQDDDASGINNFASADSTINNSGSIITASADAYGIMNLSSAGSTISNSGSISTMGSNAYGIFNSSSADSTITNSGSISTISFFAHGVLNESSANSTISNSGSILTTSVEAHGIYNDDSADSTISNSGSIQTTHQDAVGIHNTNSARSTISNSGSISTAGSFALLPSFSYGIFNNASANSTISNSGSIRTIRETAHGIVNSFSASSTISNSGTISTTNGSAAGVYNLFSTGSTISNSGTISTEHFDAFGILNQNSANTTISNSGSISTMGNSSHGIFSNRSSANSTIHNSGSIRVDHSYAIGIRSDAAITVINSGLVFARSAASIAFELSTGNDILTLSAGSRIQGLIDLINGDDTVTLSHGGNDIAWRWTFENFKNASPDVLSVIGAPYVVEDAGDSTLNGGAGITVTVADLSREANAGAVLADLTGAVRGAVTGRIAEAWALSDAGLSTGAAMTDEDGKSLGWNAWAKAFGGYQDRGSQADAGGLSPDTRHAFGGVVVGADTAPTDSALFGAFGGFAVSKLSFADASLNNTGAPDIDTNTLFGGIYGRIASAHGLFADGTLSIGYADGDADKRLQANNLVTGGVEEITGGDASGFYAASSVTLGAHVPVGTSSAVFIPSATFGYATQWRKGYSEDASIEGAMSVEDYMASVLTARLQLATQMSRSTTSGMGWTTALRGGIDLQKDVSRNVEFTMLSTALSADAGPDDTQVGGFLGLNLAIAHSDTIAFTLDGEMTFAGNTADEVGGTLNAGVRARF